MFRISRPTRKVIFQLLAAAVPLVLPSDIKKNTKVVVVGGGTAGVGVSAMLKNEGIENITVIEPSKTFYYQPLWTFVGGGHKDNKDSVKQLSDVLAKDVKLVSKSVISFNPEENCVVLDDNTKVSYDYLVVAAGIQLNWDKVPGMKEGVSKKDSGVVSIYDFDHCANTCDTMEKFKGGRMLFTMPVGAIKCRGAPQKIMWLTEERLAKTAGLREKTSVEYWIPDGGMFGVKKYSDFLDGEAQRRGVKGNFSQELVAIDNEKKVATFKSLKDNTLSEQPFDVLHVVPPMSAPKFIADSPLADASGYVEVNKYSMQSPRYKNVFAIGDCCSAPTSKTAAAVISEAPVVVHNLLQAMQGKKLDGVYTGYSSCPLVLGENRVLLAEFGYDGVLMETFGTKTGRFPLNLIGQDGTPFQQRLHSFIVKTVFSPVYFKLWTKGMWYGPSTVFKPDVTAPVVTAAK